MGEFGEGVGPARGGVEVAMEELELIEAGWGDPESGGEQGGKRAEEQKGGKKEEGRIDGARGQGGRGQGLMSSAPCAHPTVPESPCRKEVASARAAAVTCI